MAAVPMEVCCQLASHIKGRERQRESLCVKERERERYATNLNKTSGGKLNCWTSEQPSSRGMNRLQRSVSLSA